MTFVGSAGSMRICRASTSRVLSAPMNGHRHQTARVSPSASPTSRGYSWTDGGSRIVNSSQLTP